MKYILHYDSETTGFVQKSLPLHDPRQCKIVQIGAILDDENRNEVMRLDVIIALKGGVPPDAARIHGITTEISQKIGVAESNAMNTFLDMVEVADIIVGQNVIDFDNVVVTANARRILGENYYDLDPFLGKEIFDTMVSAKPICRIPGKQGGFKKPNLTEIHKHFFGEGFDKAHSAINDVLAARRCYYAIQDLMQETIGGETEEVAAPSHRFAKIAK